ncbi:NmrA-like protein, partial [Athelia psychrophila]
MSRIVAVFGATGTQGSSVVNALLQDKTFSPRAITRNPSSDAAKALAARGVEVVTGDLWDKESIRKAVAGCEAVFG